MDVVDENNYIETEEVFPTMLCCECGVEIEQNACSMCVACLKEKVDITEDIHKSLTIHSCRNCGRWLCPPWQELQLESKELMATCLRKINGLSKVKLIDATWIWTEPHSGRLKIKITVQKEVMNGAVLQQSSIVEFTIRNQQCVRCQSSFAAGAWHAVVQVRQRATHKRTFFFLEQLLLKYNAHSDAVNIVTFRDGMDFYFMDRGHGVKFVDFLVNHVPVKTKYSRKLVSADHTENTGNFKHNHYVEIAPLCRDDLLILPKDLSKSLSNVSRLVLVKSVAADIHIFDPFTCEKRNISADKYWNHSFNSTMNSRQMIRFIVLSVELLPITVNADGSSVRPSAKVRGGIDKKLRMAEVVVAREKDFGVNDTQFTCKTHLGNVLRDGDTVLGYDISTAHWAQAGELDELLGPKNKTFIPDILLVRKQYPTKGERKWILKQLEIDERNNAHSNLSNVKEEETRAEEYEEFMQEIEADREMRKHINLYKKPKITARFKGEKKSKIVVGEGDGCNAKRTEYYSPKINQEGAQGDEDGDWRDVDSEDDSDTDENKITLDELLDDMTLSEELPESRVISQEEADASVDILSVMPASTTSDAFGATVFKPTTGTTSSVNNSNDDTFDAEKYKNTEFKFT